MGLGHLGVPWGWVSWGVRRWGCGLGLDGVLVTLDAVSLAAACGAAGDACAKKKKKSIEFSTSTKMMNLMEFQH